MWYNKIMKVSDEKFDEIVDNVWKKIPRHFKEEIENVGIIVLSEPNRDHLEEMENEEGRGLLLGLFEGVPKTEWGTTHFGVQPSKITLFREPIKKVSKSVKDLKITIHVVLMHEVAHYFGYNDDHLCVMDRKLEKKLLNEYDNDL